MASLTIRASARVRDTATVKLKGLPPILLDEVNSLTRYTIRKARSLAVKAAPRGKRPKNTAKGEKRLVRTIRTESKLRSGVVRSRLIAGGKGAKHAFLVEYGRERTYTGGPVKGRQSFKTHGSRVGRTEYFYKSFDAVVPEYEIRLRGIVEKSTRKAARIA